MKIFVSYASDHLAEVEPVAIALRNRGHTVFFDDHDLPPGGSYEERIATAIARSDFFVFMMSPESLSTGRYTLSELERARQKWPSPKHRVLPVLLRKASKEAIPAYLSAVTWLEPKGNLAAEVCLAVERIRKKTPIALWAAGLVTVAALGGAGVMFLPGVLSSGEGPDLPQTAGASPAGGDEEIAPEAGAMVPLPDEVANSTIALKADGEEGLIALTRSAIWRIADGEIVDREVIGDDLDVTSSTVFAVDERRWAVGQGGGTFKVRVGEQPWSTVQIPRNLDDFGEAVSRAARDLVFGDADNLWIATGVGDGEPGLFHARVGADVREPDWVEGERFDIENWRLKPAAGDSVLAVSTATIPSTLWWGDGERLSTFGGHDFELVSCTNDVALRSAAETAVQLWIVDCDNNLALIQLSRALETGEVELLDRLGQLPTPVQGDIWEEFLIAEAGGSVLVAVSSIDRDQSMAPVRLRLVEITFDGVSRILIDRQDVRGVALEASSGLAGLQIERRDGGREVVVLRLDPG